MITFRDGILHIGETPVAWIQQPELGHAIVGAIEMVRQVGQIVPTDATGVRLLQTMAREIEEKLTQPAQ